jgi:glyoxylase-like metal-dependent hydrolase (beta-lactamase superfamily II)
MPLSETDTIPLPPVVPGVARALSPLVRRVAAEETPDGELGLNTYLIGIDEIVVVDPGPEESSHLDILSGCGGDRIRWIILTNPSEQYSAGALELKKRTGAAIIAPETYEHVDTPLTDGFKIDATEFRLYAIPATDDDDSNFVLILEQERTIFSGDNIANEVSGRLKELIKPFRIKSIAPGHGQYVEDARSLLR